MPETIGVPRYGGEEEVKNSPNPPEQKSEQVEAGEPAKAEAELTEDELAEKAAEVEQQIETEGEAMLERVDAAIATAEASASLPPETSTEIFEKGGFKERIDDLKTGADRLKIVVPSKEKGDVVPNSAERIRRTLEGFDFSLVELHSVGLSVLADVLHQLDRDKGLSVEQKQELLAECKNKFEQMISENGELSALIDFVYSFGSPDQLKLAAQRGKIGSSFLATIRSEEPYIKKKIAKDPEAARIYRELTEEGRRLTTLSVQGKIVGAEDFRQSKKWGELFGYSKEDILQYGLTNYLGRNSLTVERLLKLLD